MKDIGLNPGGIIGGLIGLGAVAGLLYMKGNLDDKVGKAMPPRS